MNLNMTSTKVLHDVVLKAASEYWFLYQLTTILFLHLIAQFPSVKFDEISPNVSKYVYT